MYILDKRFSKIKEPVHSDLRPVVLKNHRPGLDPSPRVLKKIKRIGSKNFADSSMVLS
jgi:hypothetical protein